MKHIARKFLEKEGFKFLFYEKKIYGGRVDMLMENTKNGNKMAVECCSCRIDKAIDFLKEGGNKLMIVISPDTFDPKYIDYVIVERGPNWDKFLKFHEDYQSKCMKKIKNPLDNL